jgi:tryptophan-rich sensory protein
MLENRENHILIPIIIALFLNYIISTRNWDNKYKNKGLLPKGYLVGIIWIFIFMLLGNAHYILYKKNKISIASVFLILVLLYCISYPIITQLNQKKGKIMNTISLILSSVLMLLVFNESIEAFYYTVPLFLWTSFVNYSDSIICSNFMNY